MYESKDGPDMWPRISRWIQAMGTSDLYPGDKKIPRKTTIVKSIGVFWKEKQLLILERTAQDRESIATCNNGEKLKSKYR